jgi:hypothetical protein
MAIASTRVLCHCHQAYHLPPRLLAFAILRAAAADGIHLLLIRLLLTEIFTSAQVDAAPRVVATADEVFGLSGAPRTQLPTESPPLDPPYPCEGLTVDA